MLAWKLCRERRVVDDLVIPSNVVDGLRVYRERRRGRNSKYKANNCYIKYDMTICSAGCDLTQCYTLPTKEEPIQESFPGSRQMSDR